MLETESHADVGEHLLMLVIAVLTGVLLLAHLLVLSFVRHAVFGDASEPVIIVMAAGAFALSLTSTMKILFTLLDYLENGYAASD